MVASCQDLRDGVALCLQRSDCVLVERHTPKQCLQDPELSRTLPEPCVRLFMQYLKCKHGQANQSTRFVGNGPLSTGKYERDLELLRRGDFDPVTERAKALGAPDAPVQSRAEVATEQLRDHAAAPEPRKGWFKWW